MYEPASRFFQVQHYHGFLFIEFTCPFLAGREVARAVGRQLNRLVPACRDSEPVLFLDDVRHVSAYLLAKLAVFAARVVEAGGNRPVYVVGPELFRKFEFLGLAHTLRICCTGKSLTTSPKLHSLV